MDIEQGFVGAASDLKGVDIGAIWIGCCKGADLGVGREVFGDLVVAESGTGRCVVAVADMDEEVLYIGQSILVGYLHCYGVVLAGFVVEFRICGQSVAGELEHSVVISFAFCGIYKGKHMLLATILVDGSKVAHGCTFLQSLANRIIVQCDANWCLGYVGRPYR